MAEPTTSAARRRAWDFVITALRILVPMFDAFMGIDQDNWSAFGNLVARRAGALVALLVVGLVVNWMLHRLIDRLVKRAEEGVLPDRLTNGKLGRSTTEPPPGLDPPRAAGQDDGHAAQEHHHRASSSAIVVTMMLGEIGLNIGPIVASAGIVGVALGFGSQTLVKDFLSGIFMIFEDQYGVGDVVDMGEGLTGTVEAVSLRVTRMRDTNGTVWYVRNGELLPGRQHEPELGAHRARRPGQRPRGPDAGTPRAHRRDPRPLAGRRLRRRDHRGAGDLGHRGDHARTRSRCASTLKTAPMEQWRVARVLRARIKSRFDHEGIQAPYPTSYVMNRTPGDPEGTVPADEADEAGDS